MKRSMLARLLGLALIASLPACDCTGHNNKDAGPEQPDANDDGGDFDAGPPLSLAAMTPPGGPSSGGTPVTLLGTGFNTGVEFSFGCKPMLTPTVKDETTVVGYTPP